MTETHIDTAPPSEAGILAGELAGSFARLVREYETHFRLPHAEAVRRASLADTDGGDRVLHGPPDQVSWGDLDRIARTDPDRAAARWEEIKRAALDELQTGHRAARAVETPGNDRAWQRAQFLALCDDLTAEWRPRNGIERQLLDTVAQAQTCYLHWLQTLTARTALCSIGDPLRDGGAKWQAPRQTDADAIDQAADMMERFNRLSLRTLRTLRDLRRIAGPVIVQNAGQVNVGGQQINVTQG
jgi:hypothetical protein